MTALSLPIVVAAFALGAAWCTAAALYPVWGRLVQRWPPAGRWALVVAVVPVAAGAALALACLLPWDPHLGHALGCHCTSSMPQWTHLCPVHPERAAAAVPIALIVLAGVGVGQLRALWAVLCKPLGRGSGVQPRVVDLERPLAMLWGWWRPTIVVDRRLWSALTTEHRRALVAHERAHLRRRDPMVLWILELLTAFGPPASRHDLVRTWLDHAEHQADAAAARALGDPLLVAEALVQGARAAATPGPSALAWTGGRLERRIQALIDPSPPALVPAWTGLHTALIIALAVLATVAAPTIHHQVEHLLNLAL